MMNDYVTRAEFEELKAMLTCRGDGQSIEVDNTPGGQTIRSISVVTPEAEEPEYVSVSYDSGTEKFTVTITNVPITPLTTHHSNSGTDYPSPTGYDVNGITTRSETFIFNKPASDKDLRLLTRRRMTNESSRVYDILWCNVPGPGTIASSDTDTQKMETYYLNGTTFCEITLKTDGTYTIGRKPTQNSTILTGNRPAFPDLYVDVSGARIVLSGIIDPINRGNTTSYFLAYSAPVNSQLILGYTYGDPTVSLDYAANIGLYDKYEYIGSVQIESNGAVIICSLTYKTINSLILPPGLSTSWVDGDGNTLTAINGILVNKESPPP